MHLYLENGARMAVPIDPYGPTVETFGIDTLPEFMLATTGIFVSL